MARNTRSTTGTTTKARSSIRPTPWYAAVGAGDLMVEKIRHTDLERESERLQDLIEARAKQRVAEVKAIPSQVLALPERAQAVATEAIGSANEVYVDLAQRGEQLIARIRGQESTQVAKRQARSTTSQAKATTTSARRTATKAQDAAAEATDEAAKATKSAQDSVTTSAQGVKRAAKTTSSRAKATRTSARKTAESSAKAATEAAQKVGD